MNVVELKQKQYKISKTCEKIDKLKYTPIGGDVDTKMMSALRESLENTLEELENFKWTPLFTTFSYLSLFVILTFETEICNKTSILSSFNFSFSSY